MAAVPKKKKATTKTTPTNEEPEVKALPIVGPEDRTFVMSMDEIYSLVQILGFSRDIFKQMSLNYAVEGDAQAEQVYRARSELSDILFNKIRTVASIGEPTSRAFH